MSYASKHKFLYNDKPDRLPEGADHRAMFRCDQIIETCHGLLSWMVKRNLIDGVRFLLENGVPFCCYDFHYLEWMCNARTGPNGEMAQLMRKHNAPVFPYILALCNPAHPATVLNTQMSWQDAEALPYWKAMLNTKREPYAAYRYAHALYEDLGDVEGAETAPKGVLPQWPPEGVRRDTPLGAQGLDATMSRAMVQNVANLWEAIKELRRDEAKRLSPYNWRRARLGVRMRAIAMYWWGETQKRACAPDGTGRKRDREAFRAEFE